MSSGAKERVLIPSLSDCDPGLRPSEFNVLVLPETIPEKTKGGIILTDSAKDSDKAAGRRARLVSMSPVAFSYAEFPDGTKPVVGDIVLVAKYAGTLVEGLDGREYRILKDQDVMAVESTSQSKADYEKALNMVAETEAYKDAWKRGDPEMPISGFSVGDAV